ncbi:MAG TPA: c-type cytochrome [Granulicella sp.]|jgi:cytochrome c
MKSALVVPFTLGILLLAALSKDTALAMQSAATGDAVRGRQVFEKRCTGCHTMVADREGPQLAGVFGRRAGSVAGYAYSAGLKKSGTNGLVWDDVSLEKWLSDPDALVPDNNMEFRVPKTQERLDLIAYLKRTK